MTKIEVEHLLKKRILAQKLDIKIFVTSYISMIFINLFIIKSFIGLMLVIIIFPLIFFLIIPYIFHGYTFGMMLVGIQIVNVQLTKERIPLLVYLKKIIYEFKFIFKRKRYSIYSRFPTVKYYPMNSLGQFPFDEKLNVTVISTRVDSSKNFNKNKVKYYEIEDLNKNFDIYGRKKIFIVQSILYLFWFIIIFTTYHFFQ